jgi:hypothetical protein
MPPVFISDLDGTLLRPDATLSPFARETLTHLLGEGLLFTVASARSHVSIRQILGDLPLTLPVIENNGAYLTNLRTGEHLHTCHMPPEVVEDVFDLGDARSLRPVASTTDGLTDHLLCQEVTNAGMDWYVAGRIHFQDERLRVVPDVRASLRGDVTMLTFIDRLEALAPLNELIRARFDGRVMMHFYENPYSPGWHWLTVQDGSVSKGEALRVLAEHAGFALEDVVAFGDAENDLAMFKVAGHAVATTGAVEATLAAADEIIGSCAEDAVVRWILAAL